MQITFKKEFAKAVQDGTKRQTIRPNGKLRYKTGQRLTLVTGARFAPKTHLGTAVLVEVQPITIDPVNEMVHYSGRYMADVQIKRLAKADGFQNPNHFFKWFKKQYGDACATTAFQLLRWEPAAAPRLLGTQHSLFTEVPATPIYK